MIKYKGKKRQAKALARALVINEGIVACSNWMIDSRIEVTTNRDKKAMNIEANIAVQHVLLLLD